MYEYKYYFLTYLVNNLLNPHLPDLICDLHLSQKILLMKRGNNATLHFTRVLSFWFLVILNNIILKT